MAIGEVICLLIGTVFELPSGVLADLIGRRLTVAIGLLLDGIGYILISQATNFTGYIIFFSICSIGNSFVSGAEEALLYDTLKEANKLDIYAKVKSIESLIYRSVLMASTVLGGYIYKIKVFLPHLITGITLLIGGLIYMFAKEPSIDSKKFTFKNYLSSVKLGFRETFKNTNTTITTIYYILIFCGSGLLMMYFELPYLNWQGLDAVTIGWIFGIIFFVRIFTMLLAPKIEKWIKYKKINFFLPFITGIFLLFSFRNQIWGVIILIVENIILQYRYVFTQKTYNKKIESKYRASAISTANIFNNLLYIALVYGITKGLELGNVGYSFNIIGILFLVAAILSFKLSDKAKFNIRIK